MARDFMTVYENIMAVAPKELVDDLNEHVKYWAPEVVWYELSKHVNKHIKPCSTNPQSIAIYAELCDLSLSDMKSEFEKNHL